MAAVRAIIGLVACMGAGLGGLADAQSSGSSARLRAAQSVVVHLGDLQPPQGLILTGIDGFDRTGWSVSDGGDINADGYMDLLIGAPLAGYECRDIPVALFARESATADFDLDGDVDFATVSYSTNSIYLFQNDGEAAFSAPDLYATMGARSAYLLAADLDGDSDSDLATANWDSDNLSVLLNAGDGTFAAATLWPAGDFPYWLDVGDIDLDGDLDLVCANKESETLSTHFNDGAAGFGTPSVITLLGREPYSVGLGHLNGDSVVDAVVANYDDSDFSTFIGVGDGSFMSRVDYPTPAQPTSAIIADLDGDGDGDVAATSSSGPQTVHVFEGDSSGGLSNVGNFGADESTRNIGSADLDGDGAPELFVTDSNRDVRVYRNLGGLAFGPETMLPLPATPAAGADLRDVEPADFDGDGDLDLLVSAPGISRVCLLENDGIGGFPDSPDQGEVYVLFGGPALASLGVMDLADLDGSNGFVISGVGHRDQLGFTVAALGDFNGDGIADFAVGAPFADPVGRPDAGCAYVIFGSVGLGASGSIDLEALDGSNGFVFHGRDGIPISPFGDQCGTSVAGIGDFNGDGFPDLAVGAPWANDRVPSTAVNMGNAYLLRGGPGVGASGVVEPTTLNGTNGMTWYATTGNNNLQVGQRVAGFGDMNADGFADLGIRAPSAPSTDRTYVVFGRSSAFTSPRMNVDQLNNGTQGFYFTDGAYATGLAMAPATDFNGDGRSDVLVGQPEKETAPERGRLMVLRGGPNLGSSGMVDLATVAPPAGFAVAPFQLDEAMGSSAAGNADFNEDGYSDLLIGAPGQVELPNNFGYRSGYAVLLYGGPALGANGTISTQLLEQSQAIGFLMLGEEFDDAAGWSVTYTQDLDGDGKAEIVVGAPGFDPNKSVTGKVYVLFSRTP